MSSTDMSAEGTDGGSGAKVATIIVGTVAVILVIKMVLVIKAICKKRAQKDSNTVTPDDRFLTVTMDKFLNDMEREKPIRFNFQQLRIATDNFTHSLGSGGFGAVYKGIFSNGTFVAVKVLHPNSSKSIEEQFMAEVSTIGRIHHFNLLRLYGFCFERNLIALVYEYMGNGSLDKYLFRKNNVLGFDKLLDIAVGTAKGIAYLHEECQQRIVHYDIKPENILLDASFFPKVADFGLAKLCNRENTHITMTGRRGTPGYAAPELWRPCPITFKCDVYSFGVLLFEIICRRRQMEINLPQSQEWLPDWVWKKYENGELQETMIALGIEEIDRERAERMMKVALWCVQDKPEARPMMSVVVTMLEGATEIPTPPYPYRHILGGSPWSEQPAAACPPWNGSSTFDFSSLMTTESSLMTDATPIMQKYEIALAST